LRKFQTILILILAACFLAGFAGISWAADASAAADAQININTASADQLSTLKGIGPALAKRIVDYRQANGDFKTIEDLTQVKGIGEKTLADISESITVGIAAAEVSE